MKGLICNVSCKFTHGEWKARFKKGHIYPVVQRDDGRWFLINDNDKARIEMNKKLVDPALIKKYFRTYNPIKKKSKFERWRH